MPNEPNLPVAVPTPSRWRTTSSEPLPPGRSARQPRPRRQLATQILATYPERLAQEEELLAAWRDAAEYFQQLKIAKRTNRRLVRRIEGKHRQIAVLRFQLELVRCTTK